MDTKRPKVLITNSDVPKVAIDILSEKCDIIFTEGCPPSRTEILSKSKGVHGILWIPMTSEKLNDEVLDAAGPQLKAISTMSVGIDFVNVEQVKNRKIALGYTPDVLNEAVADVAIGLMIAASRRFHEGRLQIEKNQWKKHPQWLLGVEIRDSKIGIFGFGRIGEAIVQRLQGFGISELLYTGRSVKPHAEKYKARFVSFDYLLEESDFIIVAAPLTNETREIFNETAFNKMKNTCVFVNIARGQLVDQDALVSALQNGQIFAAGLDVMTPEPLPSDNPLMSLPNCVIIPHIASATIRTRNDMATIAALNVLNGVFGEVMVSPVP